LDSTGRATGQSGADEAQLAIPTNEKEDRAMGSNGMKRRDFLRTTLAAGVGALGLTGGMALGQTVTKRATELVGGKVNLAFIGCGGIANSAFSGCTGENFVAMCDVDDARAAGHYKKFPDVPKFKDFRVMLDKMSKEIDAVVVSTPDHTHFAAAFDAMRRGIHVYVQKPLTHNVWQARTLQRAAHKYNVITQMGNQGHATEGIRLVKEWYEAGSLGEVREVLAWFNGPNFKGQYFRKPMTYPPAGEPIPTTLDWDLWQGPAQTRDFSPEYVPLKWRGYFDFGNGELGDWACHTLDAPFWALDLGMPTVVEPVQRAEAPEGFVPDNSIIRFEFAARGNQPPVTLTWHDGGLKPENRPEWGLEKISGSGMLMVGSKATLMTGGRPDSPKLVPDAIFADFRKNLPAKTIERIKGGPFQEWLRAIKGEGPMPGSNFDYSARLTEMTLLGVLAQRTNQRIEWDETGMKVTNHPELRSGERAAGIKEEKRRPRRRNQRQRGRAVLGFIAESGLRKFLPKSRALLRIWDNSG
jgi:predicted dehydrogenase